MLGSSIFNLTFMKSWDILKYIISKTCLPRLEGVYFTIVIFDE